MLAALRAMHMAEVGSGFALPKPTTKKIPRERKLPSAPLLTAANLA